MTLFHQQFRPIASKTLVTEVIESLRNDGSNCQFVTHQPEGYRIDPAEIWIERIGVWVYVSGWCVHVAHFRGPEQLMALEHRGGAYYPTRWQAWRLRRAARTWDKHYAS